MRGCGRPDKDPERGWEYTVYAQWSIGGNTAECWRILRNAYQVIR